MSNLVRLPAIITSIPQLVAGSVPAAEKFVFGPSAPAGVAANRFREMAQLLERQYMQLAALVTNPGVHPGFTIAIDASHDGVRWFGAQYALPTAATFTLSKDGVVFAATVGQAGFMLPSSGRFRHPYWRVGIAGTGGAAGGTADLEINLVREV